MPTHTNYLYRVSRVIVRLVRSITRFRTCIYVIDVTELVCIAVHWLNR